MTRANTGTATALADTPADEGPGRVGAGAAGGGPVTALAFALPPANEPATSPRPKRRRGSVKPSDLPAANEPQGRYVTNPPHGHGAYRVTIRGRLQPDDWYPVLAQVLAGFAEPGGGKTE